MCTAIAHRSPGDSGVWNDAGRGISLGFRRVAIIGISPAGHQPMASVSGRDIVVFNGEIYNFFTTRAELGDSVHWSGHSDTAVLQTAIERWGIRAGVERRAGMFAIALWN